MRVAPFLKFTGLTPVRDQRWSWDPPTAEKKRVSVLEVAVHVRVLKSALHGVWLFHTKRRHQILPLAKQSRLMWLYSGPKVPDRVSREELPDDEREDWGEVGGPEPFDRKNLPYLVLAPLMSSA